MKTTQYETEQEVRAAFWDAHPSLKQNAQIRFGHQSYENTEQNSHNAETREAFVNFVDYLARDGAISEELAGDVTL